MHRSIRFLFPIILIILLIPAILFACKNVEVATFSLRITGADLSWDSVEGADHYILDCTTPDGSGYSLRTTKCAFTAPQTDTGDYLYVCTAYDAKGAEIARSEPTLYHLGVGGYNDPIIIASTAELLSIKSGSTSVPFGNKTVDAPLYYKLASDLDCTDVQVTPIGTSSAPFRGYFDGNGHTISNLSFTQSNADGRMGLFGTATQAVIKDLTLKNASLVMDKDSKVSGSGLEYGLLVAYAKDTVIDNCHVTGNIDFMTKVNTSGSSTADLGGVVGYLVGGKIFASSFEGRIDARYSQTFAGGIAGYASSGSQALVIANCLSHATINAYGTGYDYNNKESKAKARAGILIGSISGADRIAMCLALGTATSQAAGEAATGTNVADITAGVFGHTAGSSTTNTVPMIDIFYNADTIQTVSGTRTVLGSGNTAFGLTAEELKDVSKYVVGDTSALDFDNIWAMGDAHPVLRGKGQTFTHEDVTFVIKSEVADATYIFSLQETFLPKYYSLTTSGETRHYAGFQLNDMITNSLALTLDDAKEVVISAVGTEDIHLAVNKSAATFPSTYLLYGTYHNAYSRLPEAYTGVRILDATKPNAPYDLTGNTITITIVKADETPAE